MNINENLLNPAERGVKYNFNRQVFFCLKNNNNNNNNNNILSQRMNGMLLSTSSISGM